MATCATVLDLGIFATAVAPEAQSSMAIQKEDTHSQLYFGDRIDTSYLRTTDSSVEPLILNIAAMSITSQVQ